MTTLLQDLRYALRQLRRAPGFALTAVLTLALGIGANTAIFSLLDQALLRSLPVRDPQQLVILQGTGKMWQGHTSGHGGDASLYFSYPMYRDLLSKNKSFSGIIATSSSNAGIVHSKLASVEDAELVSGNYFTLLGVRPALGRLLSEADDTAAGTNQVTVLSFEYWRDHLGSDPAIAGQTLQVNGNPVTVVGVAQAGFRSAVWGQTPALFVPISMATTLDPYVGKEIPNHTTRWINLIARLRDGTSASSAEAELAPLWHALRAEELKALGTRSSRFVDDFVTNSRLHVLPGAQGLSYSRERLQKPLYVVMGMAVLVLLIAAVNVASLLLVRSAARVNEFAIRYALGATARNVITQLLIEGLLIGLIGAAVGVLLAPLAIHAISSRITSAGDPAFFHDGIDGRMLLSGFAVALLVSVAFSLVPALQLMRPSVTKAFHQQSGTAGPGRLYFRRGIVSLQVGLSVLLLMGSGLFVRTLHNLRHTNIGFDTSHLLTFRVEPSLSGYSSEQAAALQKQALESLAAIPGIQQVAGTDSAVLANNDNGTNVTVEGYVAPPDEDLDIGRIVITPKYFSTLREPILFGRDFSEADDAAHPLVAIVNQSFARHYFGSDAAAVGKRMARGAGNKLNWMEIVGVSADAKHISLRDDVKMTAFSPLLQDATASRKSDRAGSFNFYLRTANVPSTAIADVQATMRRIAPAVALRNLRTMDEQIDQNLVDDRIIGLLAVSFGMLATLLAGIGLYGVLAYSTAQRTREIGIRIALGSSRLAVSRLVLADVLKLTGIGVAIAIPCALLLARTLRSQLYGVSATDPLTLVSVIVLIAAVALMAALLPTRRAATINPNVALRSE